MDDHRGGGIRCIQLQPQRQPRRAAAESRAEYLPILKTYVVELSHLVHSEAQRAGEPSKFLVAADNYQQFVEAFPDDPAVAQNLFLLGEVYTDAKRPGDAVAAYQRVVREHPDYERANEAGYAAILGLTEVLESMPEGDRELWQRVRIDAQILHLLLLRCLLRCQESHPLSHYQVWPVNSTR